MRKLSAFAVFWVALVAVSIGSAAMSSEKLHVEQIQQSDIEVDVQLILAVDVSRSMSPRELEIQRKGYAEALTSKPVIDAIQGGFIGRVALAFFEWAGPQSQRMIVNWTLVSNRTEAEAFADKVRANFNPAMRRTSISGALDFAAKQFENNGFISLRRVIDVSGDGPNNQGEPVLAARKRVLDDGIIVNGLPLMTKEGMGVQFSIDNLDEYYRHCVTGGPGSFVIPVLDWHEFPEAVRRKLVLELAGLPLSEETYRSPIIHKVADEQFDCLIGEKIWQRIQNRFFLP